MDHIESMQLHRRLGQEGVVFTINGVTKNGNEFSASRQENFESHEDKSLQALEAAALVNMKEMVANAAFAADEESAKLHKTTNLVIKDGELASFGKDISNAAPAVSVQGLRQELDTRIAENQDLKAALLGMTALEAKLQKIAEVINASEPA